MNSLDHNTAGFDCKKERLGTFKDRLTKGRLECKTGKACKYDEKRLCNIVDLNAKQQRLAYMLRKCLTSIRQA
jgi:hypothetical protein